MKQTIHKKYLLDFVLNSRYTNLFYTIIKLGIPELTCKSYVHVDTIAKDTDADAGALFRILRALAGIKVFKEEGKQFKLRKRASSLLKDSENSVTDVILWIVEWKRKVWDEVLYSVKTGKPSFDYVYKKPLFDFLKSNPDAQELFDKVMAQRTKRNTAKIINSYDFSKAKTIVDVGGGDGTLLSNILLKNKNAEGILFDSSRVNNSKQNHLEKNKLQSRSKFIEGDFFKSIPEGGDIYILKEVIHDWNDQKTLIILNNCVKGMKKDSKILIVEHVINPDFPDSLLLDISMLLTTGGQERTTDEFKQLLKDAGLTLSNVYSTGNSLTILECSIYNDNN